MASPFVGEIRMFGFNFPPKGWAFCDGQLLPISQNTALFSLLGTFYGGNGQSTFALPNLMGQGPIHEGSGAGLSQRFLGEQGGSSFVTLITSEMPAHSHGPNPNCVSGGGLASPETNFWGESSDRVYVDPTAPPLNPVNMSAQALSLTGGSLPHNNMPPYLVVNFSIAMQGVFPPRQ
jgi:microcystin-dependent protein